jgi:hypothetical protein
LQAVPGIESVSHVWGSAGEEIRVESRQSGNTGASVVAQASYVGPDYLQTYGVSPLDAARELWKMKMA